MNVRKVIPKTKFSVGYFIVSTFDHRVSCPLFVVLPYFEFLYD